MNKAANMNASLCNHWFKWAHSDEGFITLFQSLVFDVSLQAFFLDQIMAPAVLEEWGIVQTYLIRETGSNQNLANFQRKPKAWATSIAWALKQVIKKSIMLYVKQVAFWRWSKIWSLAWKKTAFKGKIMVFKPKEAFFLSKWE